MIAAASTADRPPDISDAEHASVHRHLPPLWEALCATGERRARHVGIVMHWLCLGLTRDEIAVSLAYLHAVLRKEIN